MSNFTQTLDLFGELLEQNNMKFQRLDGSINANKRQVPNPNPTLSDGAPG